MIANISQSINLKPLIDYNKEKVQLGDASVLEVGNVFNNDIDFAEKVISAYGNNPKTERKDKFLHVSLNFLPEDNAVLTNTMLKDIVKDYLIGIGFDEEHPYLVYKHFDTLHPHVHIVTSKINVNGKCVDKANNYRQSQRVTREIEKKYSLKPVNSFKLPNYSIKSEREIKMSNNFLVDKINFHINEALEVKKVQNFGDFVSYLNESRIDVRVVHLRKMKENVEISNIGLVYNLINPEFKQNQRGIKASKLYQSPTMKNLESLFKRNIEIHAKQKLHTRKVLDSIFTIYEKVTLSDLQAILLENSIKLNFKRDYNQRLVGVSFTDTKSGLKLTGESISKKYTARNLAILIDEKTILKSVDRNILPSTENGNKVYVITNNGIPKQKDNEVKSEINFDQSLDNSSLDVFEAQQSSSLQNNDAISDVDKKKFNPFKRRKRRLY